MENKIIISFEAPEALKEALRIAAFKHAISVSAYIRMTLEKELLKLKDSSARSNMEELK